MTASHTCFCSLLLFVRLFFSFFPNSGFILVLMFFFKFFFIRFGFSCGFLYLGMVMVVVGSFYPIVLYCCFRLRLNLVRFIFQCCWNNGFFCYKFLLWVHKGYYSCAIWITIYSQELFLVVFCPPASFLRKLFFVLKNNFKYDLMKMNDGFFLLLSYSIDTCTFIYVYVSYIVIINSSNLVVCCWRYCQFRWHRSKMADDIWIAWK